MTYANDMSSTPAPDVAPVTAAQCRPAPLAAELRMAMNRVVRRVRQQRSSDAITDGQYSVLAWLEKLGPLTPGDLAEHEHVQPPSMTRTVNALARDGLVERTDHPDDRRQVLVAITEAGTREIKETRRRRDVWLARKLSELDGRERKVLAEAVVILRRMVAQ